MYVLEPDSMFNKEPEDSAEILSNQLYIANDDSGKRVILKNELSDSAAKLLRAGELEFAGGHPQQARELYQKLMQVQPAYCYAYTLIGDVYFQESKYDTAKYYFIQALSRNFVDVDAHWFLADAEWQLGDHEGALKEISLAHLLNRNHTQIKERLELYRQQMGRPWNDWKFRPHYHLRRDGHRIHIAAPD